MGPWVVWNSFALANRSASVGVSGLDCCKNIFFKLTMMMMMMMMMTVAMMFMFMWIIEMSEQKVFITKKNCINMNDEQKRKKTQLKHTKRVV